MTLITKYIRYLIKPLLISSLSLPLGAMKVNNNNVQTNSNQITQDKKSSKRFLGTISPLPTRLQCAWDAAKSNTNSSQVPKDSVESRNKINSWKVDVDKKVEDKIGKELFSNLKSYGYLIGINLDSYYQSALESTIRDNEYHPSLRDVCNKSTFYKHYYNVVVDQISVNKFVNKFVNKYVHKISGLFDKVKSNRTNGNGNNQNTNSSLDTLRSKLTSKNGRVDLKGIINTLKKEIDSGVSSDLLSQLKTVLEGEDKNWIIDAIKHEAIIEGVNVGAMGLSAIVFVIFLLFSVFKRKAAAFWVIFNLSGTLISGGVLGYFLFNFFYNPYALVLPIYS